MFEEYELAYLQSQSLARLGTVSVNGQVDVDAVGFEFDGSHFYIGGRRLQGTRKYKNIVAGNTKVSVLIDDLKMTDRWEPRGIKVHGSVEVVQHDGRFGPGEYFKITPIVSWSWGIAGPHFKDDKYVPNKIVWQQ